MKIVVGELEIEVSDDCEVCIEGKKITVKSKVAELMATQINHYHYHSQPAAVPNYPNYPFGQPVIIGGQPVIQPVITYGSC